MNHRWLRAIGVVALALAACQGAPTPPPIIGTTWQAVSVAGITPVPGRVPTLKIENGVATGTTGCNTYSVPVKITADAIVAGQGHLGPALCPEQGVDEVETKWVKALAAARHIKVTNGQLVISGDFGDIVLEPGG